MAAIRSKLLDAFRRLSWSDKRKQNNLRTESTEEESDEHSESENDNEEIHLDDLDPKVTDADNVSQFEQIKHMTTFAKGDVINIVNSNQVHWGPLYIIYNNSGPGDENKTNQHWTKTIDQMEKQTENKSRKGQNTSASSQSTESHSSMHQQNSKHIP